MPAELRERIEGPTVVVSRRDEEEELLRGLNLVEVFDVRCGGGRTAAERKDDGVELEVF